MIKVLYFFVFFAQLLPSVYAEDISSIYGGIAQNKHDGERVIANCIASESGLCSMFRFYLLEPMGLPTELVDFENLRPFATVKPFSTLAIKEIIRDYRNNNSLNELMNFLILRQNAGVKRKFSKKDMADLQYVLRLYQELGPITSPQKMSYLKSLGLDVLNQFGLARIEKYGVELLKLYQDTLNTTLPLIDSYGVDNVKLYSLRNLELYGLDACENFVKNVGKKYLDQNSIYLIHFNTSELDMLAARLSKIELEYFASLVNFQVLTKNLAMERFKIFLKLAPRKIIKFAHSDARIEVIEVESISSFVWRYEGYSTLYRDNPIEPRVSGRTITHVL